MRRPACALALIALLAALSVATPISVAADYEIPTKAVQVYEVQPEAGKVHVTIDMTVRNNIPSTTTYETCTDYVYDPWYGWYPIVTTCPRTTNYYVNQSQLWVEDGARGLKITADAGSVTRSTADHVAGFTLYTVHFSRIFKGQTRKLHATYDLLSAPPRSMGGIRAGRAYVSFCTSGNGPDGGEVRVVVPSGFLMDHWQSDGLAFKQTSSNGRLTFSSGRISNPIQTWACFSGTNASGYARVSIAAPDGRSVVLEGWPEDPEWRSAVAADVALALPKLIAAIGQPLPGSGPITVREVSRADLFGYAGSFDPETQVALVGEDFRQSGLVAHELSHAWFNGALFTSTWLREGYADWAEGVVVGPSCTALPKYPGFGSPDLETWTYTGPKSTAIEQEVVQYQYVAACWVVSSVAKRIGDDGMTAVLASLFEGTNAYGASPTKTAATTNAQAATWRTWLDAVDELGMIPAGETDLDAAQDLLVLIGVATDSSELAARSAARASYHALLAEATEWQAPFAVRAPLSAWDFATAEASITSATNAYTSAREAARLVPEANVLTGPIKQQWEGAQDAAALESVAELATEAVEGANVLHTANEAAADLGIVEQIGLIGTDTEPMRQAATSALAVANTALALTTATAYLDTLIAAEGSGWVRIGIGLLILVLVIAVAWYRRRPRFDERQGRPLQPILAPSAFTELLAAPHAAPVTE